MERPPLPMRRRLERPLPTGQLRRQGTPRPLPISHLQPSLLFDAHRRIHSPTIPVCVRAIQPELKPGSKLIFPLRLTCSSSHHDPTPTDRRG